MVVLWLNNQHMGSKEMNLWFVILKANRIYWQEVFVKRCMSNTAKRDVLYFTEKNVWSVGATLSFCHTLTIDCYVISGSELTTILISVAVVLSFLALLFLAPLCVRRRLCRHYRRRRDQRVSLCFWNRLFGCVLWMSFQCIEVIHYSLDNEYTSVNPFRKINN